MERGVLLPLSHAFGDETLDVVTATVEEFLAARLERSGRVTPRR